jgi:ABC-type microcin C transport system permease subunit YejE
VLIGAVLGIMSGYVGGRFDALVMRVADFFLVIPTFVLAIILTAIIRDIVGTGSAELFGIRVSLLTIVVVIGITSWSSTARIVRSQTLSLKERAFVDRARVVGAGGGHIMRRHVLPNVTNLSRQRRARRGAIDKTTSVRGLDPFQPSWGQLLDAARSGRRVWGVVVLCRRHPSCWWFRVHAAGNAWTPSSTPSFSTPMTDVVDPRDPGASPSGSASGRCPGRLPGAPLLG